MRKEEKITLRNLIFFVLLKTLGLFVARLLVSKAYESYLKRVKAQAHNDWVAYQNELAYLDELYNPNNRIRRRNES